MIQDFLFGDTGDTGFFLSLHQSHKKAFTAPTKPLHQTSQTINSINNHGTDTTSTDNTVHRQALWIWSIRLHTDKDTDTDFRHHIHKKLFSLPDTALCAGAEGQDACDVSWENDAKKNLSVAGGRWGTLGLWEWGTMVPGIASTFYISIRIWKE